MSDKKKQVKAVNREETRTLGAVARLLEFYDKDVLHKLFHECEVNGHDISEAFEFLDLEAVEHFGKYQEVPEISMLTRAFLISKLERITA